MRMEWRNVKMRRRKTMMIVLIFIGRAGRVSPAEEKVSREGHRRVCC